MKLSHSQKLAVTHVQGPMLVLAGPGSGKTFSITRRIQNLIENHGVNPANILVITFTKAAAEEMKERFHKLMDGSYAPVNFGTFHSIYFTILKYAYNYNAENIIKSDNKWQMFRDIIDKLDLEIDDEKDFIQGIENEISIVKGERMNLDHYYSINCSDDTFKKIYNEYEARMRRSNLIDFDDMLLLCYELLMKRPDILSFWQQRFQYILIDEFQDVNLIQYDIVKLLAKPENNIFIVGDDDQSIYQFRGAKPDIMFNFLKEFKEADKVILDMNYRSTGKIVKGAAQVIGNNQNRFAKNIRTVHVEGNDIDIQIFKTLPEQNAMVIESILKYRKSGIPFSEMAVLFRTNTQPRALIEKIMEYNIPFRMKDGIPNLYEHWIAKNILDYIRIASGNRERALFLQIANRPKRYLSRECFRTPLVSIKDIADHYSDKSWMLERIHKLEYDLGMMKNMNPYAAVNYIRNGIGYEDYLKEYAKDRRMKEEELIDILNEIQEASKAFPTYQEWFEHIAQYGDELKMQQQKKNQNETDSVVMATMHSSKGLEFRCVFIVDVNEGITPHHKAMLDAELEEERRMFYVAMTRAKEYLHITAVKERYNKEMEVSRFIGELKLNQGMLKEGTVIRHKMYGEGKILMNSEGKLVIYFTRLKKERVLDLKFCISNQLLEVITEAKATGN